VWEERLAARNESPRVIEKLRAKPAQAPRVLRGSANQVQRDECREDLHGSWRRIKTPLSKWRVPKVEARNEEVAIEADDRFAPSRDRDREADGVGVCDDLIAQLAQPAERRDMVAGRRVLDDDEMAGLDVRKRGRRCPNACPEEEEAMHLCDNQVAREELRSSSSRLTDDRVGGGMMPVVGAGEGDPCAAIDERAPW
jgi:hypothetical protein